MSCKFWDPEHKDCMHDNPDYCSYYDDDINMCMIDGDLNNSNRVLKPRKKEEKKDGENLQKAIHNLWEKRPAVMAKEKERLKKET